MIVAVLSLMQYELIIRNTKSGRFSIQDFVCDFDGLRMLHLTLDDNKCIYYLLKASSSPATFSIHLYDDCGSNIAHVAWTDHS